MVSQDYHSLLVAHRRHDLSRTCHPTVLRACVRCIFLTQRDATTFRMYLDDGVMAGLLSADIIDDSVQRTRIIDYLNIISNKICAYVKICVSVIIDSAIKTEGTKSNK